MRHISQFLHMLDGATAEFSLPQPKPFRLFVSWLHVDAPAKLRWCTHRYSPDLVLQEQEPGECMFENSSSLPIMSLPFPSLPPHFFEVEMSPQLVPRSQSRTIDIA